MNKKLKYLLILLILLLIIFAAYYFFFLKEESNTASLPTSDYKQEITSSIPIIELIESPEANASTRAVQDSQGLIYYSINAPESKTIMVLDKKGTEYKRFTSDAEENIEIAGIDDNQVIYYWTNSSNPNCSDIWNTDNTYYGIGFGAISYSGSGILTIHKNEDLINKTKQQCLQ